VTPSTSASVAASAAPASGRSPQERRRLRRVGYALAGVTAATLAAAIATTVLSTTAQATLESAAQKGQQVFTPSLQQLYASGRGEALAGDICFAAAGALAVSSAVVLGIGLRRPAHELQLTPLGGRAGAGVALSGVF
jgi:hypothetical protein